MSSLNLTVQLCRRMSTYALEDASLTGEIECLNADDISLLRQLENEGKYLLPTTFDDQQYLGKKFEVEGLNVSRLQNQFFAESWHDFLINHGFHLCKPSLFYIKEEDYFSDDTAITERGQRYFEILDLINFLKKMADVSHQKINSLQLVFLNKEKLELDVKYDFSDLRNLPTLAKLSKEYLTDDPHQEQRKSLFKVVLFELVKNVPDEQKFKHLLKIFNELSKRVDENYRLYMEGFSFEKVKEEVERNRLEYSLKLNKVFSEIQNQILTIPLALILIGSQLTQENSISIKNVAVILGLLVFIFFMNMLLKNQRHSLEAINLEIIDIKDKLRHSKSSTADKLMPIYSSLDTRFKQQKRAILYVDGILALVWMLAFSLFVYYSGFSNDAHLLLNFLL